MRYSQSEKMEIIRLVEQSPLSVKQTLFELKINRSTFYQWYRRGTGREATRHWQTATGLRSSSGTRYRRGSESVWLRSLLIILRSHRVSWLGISLINEAITSRTHRYTGFLKPMVW